MSYKILPSQHILSSIQDGFILADTLIESGLIQPASLDLRLGKTAWNPVVHGKWPHNTLKSGKACTVFILTKATPDGGKSVLLSKRFALKASGK